MTRKTSGKISKKVVNTTDSARWEQIVTDLFETGGLDSIGEESTEEGEEGEERKEGKKGKEGAEGSDSR